VTLVSVACRNHVGNFDFHVASNYRDVPVLGDCDAGVGQLAALLGWQDELSEMVNAAKLEHPDAFARSNRHK